MNFPRILEAASPKEAHPRGDTRRRDWPALKTALGLLAACQARRLRVELEGFMPDKPETWLTPLEEASAQAGREGKEFVCVLRRSGRFPKQSAERLSVLGARVILEARPGEGGLAGLRRRVRALDSHGIQTVVEIVLDPESVIGLGKKLEGFETLHPAKLRFTLRAGIAWAGIAEAAEPAIAGWLEAATRRRGNRQPLLDVMNFCEEEEPELLTSRLRLTAEGALGWATALHHQNVWPELLRAFPPVPLRGLKDIDGLFIDPAQRQKRSLEALSGMSRELWLDNVGVALRLRSFFDKPFGGFRDASENKALRRGLIQAALVEQDRFLRLSLPGVESLFLFLRSGCLNDCVFCKHKADAPGQTLQEVESFLKPNRLVRRKKLALVGNEPLLHPDITGVVGLARKHGFTEVEVMTSGAPLSDPDLVGGLREAGATAFSIPLYSADPDLHDELTGNKGSFQKAVAGIKNLTGMGLKVFIHSNLMRQNLDSLTGIQKLVEDDWGLPLSLLCLRPKGSDGMNLAYAKLEPSYRETLAAGLAVDSLVGFPVCIQRRIQGEAVVDPARMADGIKLYLLHQNFVKPPSCAGCPYSPRCLGTFPEHLALYPEDQPLLRP